MSSIDCSSATDASTVAVVIPTHNRRHLISHAIDSVLSQQHVKSRVIVVDDASTDGTVEWVRQAYDDPRVQVVANAGSRGPGGARNTGMRLADTALVAFLDSDDCFLPDHLTACLRAFHEHPMLDIVFGRALYEQAGQEVDYLNPNFERKLALAPVLHRDEQITLFDEHFFDHLLEYGCYFNLCSVVFRRRILDAGYLMNEELRIAEDYEFWVRIARRFRYGCLHERQVVTRLHDSNLSNETLQTTGLNAPGMIKAYQYILGYEGLTRSQQRILHRQVASIYHDWAWRCREHGKFAEAAALNLVSMRYGRRFDNLASLLKIPLRAVIASRPS